MKMIIIREVLEKDNADLASVIRQVLIEIGVPKVGTAYSDPELDYMHKTYLKVRAAYFVLEENGILIGGAGIAHFKEAILLFVSYKKCIFYSKQEEKL